MLLKLVTGNGKRGTGSGKRVVRNEEWGKGVSERVYSGNQPDIQNGGKKKRRGNNLGKYEEMSRL